MRVHVQKEVSTPPNDLGRRAEDALLQGANESAAERVVPARPLSEPHKETRAGCSDWTLPHAGWQLVQEQTTERPGCCC